MQIDYNFLSKLSKEYGESYYIFDVEAFRENFNELTTAFKKYYDNFAIAYSYKTNYIPYLCKENDSLGGFAEVVSNMEVEIAKRVGVNPQKIIFNGPYKDFKCVKELLISCGTVNVDSIEEFNRIEKFSKDNKDKKFNIGVRVNFDVGDGVLSRFGVDALSSDYKEIIKRITNSENLVFNELHCHFASRDIDTWKHKVDGLITLALELEKLPNVIDFGGGLFSKMPKPLQNQLNSKIPTFDEYAEEIAGKFSKAFGNLNNKPKLVIEPGSALCGNVIKFVALVTGIKNIRGKSIATLLGSNHNIHINSTKINSPVEVYESKEGKEYKNVDFGGYTCIESDIMYRNYNGRLSEGDYVVFSNVGSYSVVMKPPFIMPNFSIVAVEKNKTTLIKEKETFDDLFRTYKF